MNRLLPLAVLAFLTGCSNAPVAGFLDCCSPNRTTKPPSPPPGGPPGAVPDVRPVGTPTGGGALPPVAELPPPKGS